MFHRALNLPDNKSCFLFGALGTGKSTLLRASLPPASTAAFNLLEADTEDRLARDPRALEREVLALPPTLTHVVVDEVQKLPRLLDAVHNLIETHRVPQRFILTGSSARKLKAGGANPLAGRASLRHLFPLQRRELGDAYDEDRALRFGGLPAVWNATTDDERADFLRAYAHGTLRDGIAYSVPAPMTIQAWYQVLEDTLLGFHVDGFHSSVRKQLRQAPKFYLFDTGVTRALGRMLQVPPQPGTSYFGDLFESRVMSEHFARDAYEQLDWRFSYLRTKGGLGAPAPTSPAPHNRPLRLIRHFITRWAP